MLAVCALRPLLRVLAPINEVKEVLIHVRFSIVQSTLLYMANSADPDERHFIWVYARCKCSFFGIVCIHPLTTFPQLPTLNFRQATPLIISPVVSFIISFVITLTTFLR